MEVIQQRRIVTPDDLLNLHIIDFHRTNGYWPHALAAMQEVCKAVSGKLMCTIIEHDLRSAPERSDWPGWRHGWGEAGEGENHHTRLGRAYWNACRSAYRELAFSDQPDFDGYLTDGHMVSGDIGVVSVSSFLFALGRMRVGDLWISVVDYDTQIILENQVNWPEMRADHLFGQFDPADPKYFAPQTDLLV